MWLEMLNKSQSDTCVLAWCLQCFDTVGLAPRRASVVKKLSDGVLVWLGPINLE